MNALNNITYGLYVLTAKTDKYNGCIINTLMQVTSSPARISITINKDNHTTKMIDETGVFNVSILDTTTPFDLIKRFGFSSGKDCNKFEDFSDYKLASNGIPYITRHTNAYISARVVSKIDIGTHITFVADVENLDSLANTEPLTYAYYHKHIKPKTEVVKKGVYVCKICGYIHEGDNLPEDFICPICKHGAEVFEFRAPEEPQKRKLRKFYCPVCDRIEESDSFLETCSICGATMIEVEE